MANQIIDIHSHFLTSEYLKFLEKQKALLEDGFPLPKYNNQEHLKLMRGCSIEWSLLSVSSPHPYFKDDIENSIKMCRHLNEQMAIYALDVLDADGIDFPSNSRGLYLGDPKLEPLMEELNKRHAICNIHPH